LGNLFKSNKITIHSNEQTS